MWSSQQTSYTEDLPCRFVSMNLSHKENRDNTEKAEVQCLSEAFTPQPNSIKVTLHGETEHLTRTVKLARRSPIIQSINLYKETRAPFGHEIHECFEKRSGKMDLNRELAAQKAAPPGNKNRDLKASSASPSLHLSPLHRENGGACFRRVSQGMASYQAILPTPFLEPFLISWEPPRWVFSSGIQYSTWSKSLVGLLGTDSLDDLGNETQRKRPWGHLPPAQPWQHASSAVWNQWFQRDCFLIHRMRLSPQTSQDRKKKSMRKESVLPTVIWPVRDNSGWRWHTLLPSFLSFLQKTVWSPKLWQDT